MFISSLAIRRPILTTMFIVSLIVFGWVSLRGLSLDLFPKVDFPIVTVKTVLTGADPETIETRVTDVLEQSVNTLASIKKLQSTSMEGVSVIIIEFDLEKNIDVAYQEVQQKVSAIRAELPQDVKDPIIEKVDPDASPILTLVMSGNLGPKELFHVADTEIKERLQRIRDVGSITIKGGRERKLWLWLDPQRLKSHGLTVQDVRNALSTQHVEMPGGRVEQPDKEYVTRIKAEFTSAADLDQLVVARQGSSVIRLKDVGRTEDGLEEERSYSELDGMPCVTLDIQRQSGKNTVQVANDCKVEIAKLQEEFKSRGINLQVAVDMSVYIQQSVDNVFHHLIIGGTLAVFTVLIFLLNFRSTFISAMVLPTSIMATFMMMAFAGYSLNFMTLMGLTLAIGLLIDDAIVVQENIMRHVQEGKPASFAAEFATKEIGLAVLATTLSVVAVFGPTAYTKGIVGRFIAPFGMTIAFAVLISMLVSFTLDPMLSSRMLKRKGKERGLFRILEESFLKLEHLYEKLLKVCLKRRGLVVAAAVICFVASMGLMKFAKAEFIPLEDRSEFTVFMRTPLGGSLAKTREIAEDVKATIKAVPEVKFTLATLGGDKANEGSMYVRLHDKADRLKAGQKGQREVMDLLRKELAEVGKRHDTVIGVQVFDALASSTGMKAAQVQLELLGSDLNVLDGLSKQVLARLREAGTKDESGASNEDGYKDLDTTYQPGKPEVSIYVDRERAADLGVSPLDIADTIRAAIGGVEIGKFRAGKERYDISVRMLESGRNDPQKILDLTIPSLKGTPIPLRSVAYIAPTSLPVEINRYNRQRQITVLANPEVNKPLGDAVAEINSLFTGVNGQPPAVVLPAGYHTAWSGQAEMMGESFGNLGFTMILSVLVIYMVLAAQFESVVHPFTIMLSLPLAFVGAILFLVVTRQTISIMTFMSFIFLLGLVTKNAILLIDYANTLRHRDGLGRDLAMQKAGPVRLRPILMTTFAMIFGMLPSALSTGEGSESQAPMAIAIIGGLVSSTFLTLVIVPVVYSLIDPLSEWFNRKVLRSEKIQKELDAVPTAAVARPVEMPMEEMKV